ncbi:MAG: hypothetical protein M3R02_30425 [Chloroflexota bacterium]|nr:hypothetical protein [Chloroflexota bacterium]
MTDDGMDARDRRAALDLDAFLDTIVRGESGGRENLEAPADPLLAETVRRFHALARAPDASSPPPALLTSIWEDLMAPSQTLHPVPLGNDAGASARGTNPREWQGPASPIASRHQRRWPVTEVAVAAVILLTLVTGYAMRGSGLGSSPERAASPGADSVAQVSSTTVGEARAGTPTGAPLVIATASRDEPIVKLAPTGPAPTAPPAQYPTVSSNFDADDDGLYTFAEFQQAVAALYPSYQWPATYQVDPATLLSGYAPYADRGRFEVGGEYSIIGGRHACAWELAWLDGYGAGDEALMARSLDQLRTVTLKNPMYDRSVQDALTEMLQRAELGDPAMLQQWVDGNCRNITFTSSVPTTPPATSSPAAARMMSWRVPPSSLKAGRLV